MVDRRTATGRRDYAILLLLVTYGLRADEVTKLTLDDIDIKAGTARVVGKNRRARVAKFGTEAREYLDRYVRARRRHRLADSTALWLGDRGQLTDSGIAQIVRRRGNQAGIEGLHPHVFRHSFAHLWLASGGQEGDRHSSGG